ncbi:hypothetical protein SKAU_G00332480 [Synaphobranchus kaupii]|uniref:BAH domain-containing protein n=1 Tax=Synaphobranchus kaupii TaxID=118154 RepID=A0A9Q1ELJ5_SYNKA|nr:hypothetical protein SKAU_G00332480 [Synaphobranchus kaupii]
MAANMYRVGDYVYFENSSSNPLLIRRIEELNKTANGNVEAKVVCFYRRRDISSTLIALADKHAREMEEDLEHPEIIDLPEKQKHQLRHRELFLSRQLESLPATHIRSLHHLYLCPPGHSVPQVARTLIHVTSAPIQPSQSHRVHARLNFKYIPGGNTA